MKPDEPANELLRIADEIANNATFSWNRRASIAERLRALASAEPVCWMRYLNGKPDWSEDCISDTEQHCIECFEDDDHHTYSAVALYATPQPRAVDEAQLKLAREAFARMRGRQSWPDGLTHEQFDKAITAALTAALENTK